MSLSIQAPNIQPTVKRTPAVLKEYISTIEPKKPTIVNNKTYEVGIRLSFEKLASRILVITLPKIPATASDRPRWKLFSLSPLF